MAFSGTKKATIRLLVMLFCFLYGIMTGIKRSKIEPVFFRGEIVAILLMNFMVSIRLSLFVDIIRRHSKPPFFTYSTIKCTSAATHVNNS